MDATASSSSECNVRGVGSSGSLMSSRHGRAIDAHDVVTTLNLAPAWVNGRAM